MVINLCNAGYAIAAAGSVKTASSGLGSPQLGSPRDLTIAVSVDAATDITINVSYDGETWVAASVRNTTTPAVLTFAAAGGQAVDITPAPFVEVVSSAAVHISAWAYSS